MHDKQPQNDEVLLELEKLLSHPRFAKSTLQAPLLRQMVEWTLEGVPFDGNTVGIKIVPQYDKELSSDIRKAKKLLLDWLKVYYKTDGEADEVQILLNENGYKVTFTYNPATPFLKQMAMAKSMIAQHSPLRMVEALQVVDLDLARGCTPDCVNDLSDSDTQSGGRSYEAGWEAGRAVDR